MMVVSGNIVDLFQREIYPGTVTMAENRIVSIERNSEAYDHYIIPGFVDAHVHVESSMLLPDAFAKAVIPRGTIAVLNDPHEIANVLGMKGIEMMMQYSDLSPLKFFYGIPSCVPATPFDKTGDVISANDTEQLAASGRFVALSEMMNVPGVLYHDPEVMEKLNIARRYGLKIDGHAPGLRGDGLTEYIGQGIETDHETTDISEAEEKIAKGMRILIREGSAAKNYEALKSLIATSPDKVMFCTDDSHPDDILEYGHIDQLVRRAIHDGFDLFDVLKIASVNPVLFYGMDVGLLRSGDKADFIVVENLDTFSVLSTVIDGVEVYKKGDQCDNDRTVLVEPLNLFNHLPLTPGDLKSNVKKDILVIRLVKDELVTEKYYFPNPFPDNPFVSDIEADVLKIVYMNRYNNGKPQIGFISGFGIKSGAFASCIAHDSHNILAVGCSDEELTRALNIVIHQQGGLSVVNGNNEFSLPLPIGGIISEASALTVSQAFQKLNDEIHKMGSELTSPFMTLSFMALIVIPALKIGEQGLFDGERFEYVEM